MSIDKLKNRIRIISTSDIHGKVLSHSYADGREVDYGLSKIASLIEKYRDENTILIDNGDTLEGSPLQKMHFMKNKAGASPITRAMKAVRYDYINIGNHDFDYGPDALKQHIRECGARCINANTGHCYDLREISGRKIAIFGLTTSYTVKWESEEKLEGTEFRDDYEMAEEIVSRIRAEADPDHIICCYHGGMGMPDAEGGEHQGYRILKGISDIDVMIAGHDHSTGSGMINDAVYTLPGSNGTHLSVIDIDIDTGIIAGRIISAADEKPEPSALIEEITADAEAECNKWLDEPLGGSAVNLLIEDEFDARLNKAQYVTFINRIQSEHMGADISTSSVFEGATGFGEEITMRDVVSSYSFPNTLVVKRINGRVLREYLEFNLRYWDIDESDDNRICVNKDYLEPIPKHFNYDMADGIEYRAKISDPPGCRLVKLTKNGRDIKDDDEFDIVLCNYRAAGGGGFDMLAELPLVREDATDMTDLIADYIAEKGIIDFEAVNNIEIVL